MRASVPRQPEWMTANAPGAASTTGTQSAKHGNARGRADDGVRPLERLDAGGLDGLWRGLANDDHSVPVDLLGLHEVAGDTRGPHGGERTRTVLRDVCRLIAAARSQIQASELAF